MKQKYQVIVVGGGHAGCEAALASARMGADTLILTMRPEKIAEMPCNPSIGGVGKGQLVKEIDALGGEMGKNADYTGIQFRRLNTRKGSAVQSSRCQSDKVKYAQRMQSVVENQDKLDVLPLEAKAILWKGGSVEGILARTAQGESVRLNCRAVVVTAGTFLQALMHCGDQTIAGGRVGERESKGLSQSLTELGLRLIRLKTGTPARILRNSIDFSKLKEQPGDPTIRRFSFSPTTTPLPQISCHLGFTNERTHNIIHKNLSRSPLYSGMIKGIGPRYCPSIEDKVVKFPDKDRHQVFFEPVALDSDWIYPNGISTSLPKDVQEAFVRSIEGCERAELIRYGYAVEYDCVDPTQLRQTLECHSLKGLYFAGQINGTSGYEEAAAQGLVAGINAAQRVLGRGEVTFDRTQAYIGVMIDDLVSRGVSEPYRMFTSRAEYRLYLREDNADSRLTSIGHVLGLIDSDQYQRFESKRDRVENASTKLERIHLKPTESVRQMLESCGTSAVSESENARKLLKRPEVGVSDLQSLLPEVFEGLTLEEKETLEVEVKFEGYIAIQKQEIERLNKMKSTKIPSEFDYHSLAGLSHEIKEKLSTRRPETLAEAAMLSGVTPAALTNILAYLRRTERSNA